MAVNEVEVYEYEAGTVVDPKSDTKTVFIPSPPTKMEQKINPRPVVILLGDADVEELKAKADADKVVFVLPADTENATIETTYKYIVDGAKKLNIKKNAISVKTTGCVDAAQEVVNYILDELDGEVADAEKF